MKGKKQILCIQKNEGMANLIRDALSEFSVITAKSLKEARALFIAEKSFDLILTDYSLPDGNITEFCKYINETNNPPPILITTGGIAITEADLEACGAKGVLKKDENFIKELEKKVKKLFQ